MSPTTVSTTTGLATSEHAAPPVTLPHADGGAGARRLGINAASLLACDVLNRGVTFAIYALVAHCGTYEFGQMSLSLMLLYAFQVLASVGLPTLIVRDVAKDPASDSLVLVNGSVVVCGAFIVSYALLALFVRLSGYSADTSRVILLFGLSILPWSLSLLVEAIFRAHEKMYWIVAASVPLNLLKLGMSYWALSLGQGVGTIAVILLASYAVTLLLQWVLLWRTLRSPLSGVEWAACRGLLSRSWKFFGIDLFVAVWSSVNVILVSWFHGEDAVGVFGAATQLLLPPGIALQAVANSLFPVMCRRATQGQARSRQLAGMMFEVLALIAIPGCVLLWFIARALIELIYRRDGFLDAETLVRIMLPTLILGALTRLLGQLLMSFRREDVNLRIVAIDLLFNVACGSVLISMYGVRGAAVTLLLTNVVDAGLHLFATRTLLSGEADDPAPRRPTMFWHTVITSMAMAGVLQAIGEVSLPVTIAVGSAVFLAGFVGLCGLSREGVTSLRERLVSPLSETAP